MLIVLPEFNLLVIDIAEGWGCIQLFIIQRWLKEHIVLQSKLIQLELLLIFQISFFPFSCRLKKNVMLLFITILWNLEVLSLASLKPFSIQSNM